MKGLSATESRTRFGALMEDLTDESEPVLVEAEQEPLAIGVIQANLDELRAGSIPDNWQEIVEEARQIMQRWLKGAPLPEIRELIDYGRE